MEPISQVDRLAAMLRIALAERAKSDRSRQLARKGSGGERSASGLANVRALAAVDDVDERQVRRAFVQHLLADQMDARLLNDAQFQQVVTRVTQAIDDDDATAKLLTRLIAELRAA
jgi:hypothetical protein